MRGMKSRHSAGESSYFSPCEAVSSMIAHRSAPSSYKYTKSTFTTRRSELSKSSGRASCSPLSLPSALCSGIPCLLALGWVQPSESPAKRWLSWKRERLGYFFSNFSLLWCFCGQSCSEAPPRFPVHWDPLPHFFLLAFQAHEW